ncbi:predicted protein [Nematostella vectensis]|uniref:Integrator complex subunit 8 n=1 Tax=Nematostella vectensis TaxID=45351 RepID=A7STC9_NEMVE|nr:predicted protein [Nematostella vectensis]|eukprot:XP_001625125.1 predicted protein [Nematostella vectensis]
MAEVKHPLAWFEFVFDPTGTLLENHLKDAFAVPSAAQLIVQFLERSKVPPSTNTPVPDGSLPTESKRSRHLKQLALQVAYHLDWNLEALENGLTLQWQDYLFSQLLKIIPSAINRHVPDHSPCTRLFTMYQITHHVPDYSPCTRSLTMYQITHRVPDHSPCTRSLTVYQIAHHVPDHSPCTRSLTMYQITHRVPDHLPCTRSLTMYQITYHVPDHSPCTRSLTVYSHHSPTHHVPDHSPTHHVPDHSPCTRSLTMYQITHHVPDHSPCTRSLTVYQITHHVPDHSPCTRSLTMYQITHHVPDHSPCTRSLTMYQITYHVPDHSPCTRSLTMLLTMTHIVYHVPDDSPCYSPCTRSLTMYQIAHHVPDHSPCTRSLTMYQITHRVPDHSPCTRSLTMYQITHHVPDHSPCTRSLIVYQDHSLCIRFLTMYPFFPGKSQYIDGDLNSIDLRSAMALIIYHRWVIRTLAQHFLPNVGKVKNGTLEAATNDVILKTLKDQLPSSIQILEKALTITQDLELPCSPQQQQVSPQMTPPSLSSLAAAQTTQGGATQGEKEGKASCNGIADGEVVKSTVNGTASKIKQVSFDLGTLYFYQEKFGDALKLFQHCKEAKRCKSSLYTVDECELHGYHMACCGILGEDVRHQWSRVASQGKVPLLEQVEQSKRSGNKAYPYQWWGEGGGGCKGGKSGEGAPPGTGGAKQAVWKQGVSIPVGGGGVMVASQGKVPLLEQVEQSKRSGNKDLVTLLLQDNIHTELPMDYRLSLAKEVPKSPVDSLATGESVTLACQVQACNTLRLIMEGKAIQHEIWDSLKTCSTEELRCLLSLCVKSTEIIKSTPLIADKDQHIRVLKSFVSATKVNGAEVLQDEKFSLFAPAKKPDVVGDLKRKMPREPLQFKQLLEDFVSTVSPRFYLTSPSHSKIPLSQLTTLDK